MTLSSLHYLFPQALYFLLFLAPVLLLIWFEERWRQKKMGEFSSNTLSKVLTLPSKWTHYFKNTLLCFSWLLICISLSGPIGNMNNYQVNAVDRVQKSGEVLFFIDVSASMGVRDVDGHSRIEAVKRVVENLLPEIKNASVALYAFTSEIIPLVPITDDHLFFKMALKQMQINEGGTQGTDIQAVLKRAPVLKDSTIILFSDGGEKSLSKSDLNLIAVGVGSEKGGGVPDLKKGGKEIFSRLEAKNLQQLTPEYYTLKDYSEGEFISILKNNLEVNNKKVSLESVDEDSRILIYDLYYQIPLTLALVCLLLFYFLPEVSGKSHPFLVIVLFLPQFLSASEPIHRYNEAVQALQQKKWQEAYFLLESINPEEAPSARFLIYLEENRSIALFQLAFEPYTDFNYGLYLLKKSKESAEHSLKADCLWNSCSNKEIGGLVDLMRQQIIGYKGVDGVPEKEVKNNLQKSLKDIIVLTTKLLQTVILTGESNRESEEKIDLGLHSFVMSILEYEQKAYYRYHCQITPWDSIIPSLQQGNLQFARFKKEIYLKEINASLYYLNQALVNWKRVLELLNRNEEQKKTNQTNSEYVLDRLEEMYLMDEKKKVVPLKEETQEI
jgi:hypothetical protein